jgi:hypothetical protein
MQAQAVVEDRPPVIAWGLVNDRQPSLDGSTVLGVGSALNPR